MKQKVLFTEQSSDSLLLSCRPGGELSPGEDEVEGLKRLMTEVATSQHRLSFFLLWLLWSLRILTFVLMLDPRTARRRETGLGD